MGTRFRGASRSLNNVFASVLWGDVHGGTGDLVGLLLPACPGSDHCCWPRTIRDPLGLGRSSVGLFAAGYPNEAKKASLWNWRSSAGCHRRSRAVAWVQDQLLARSGFQEELVHANPLSFDFGGADLHKG